MIFIKKYDIIYIESKGKEMIEMTRTQAAAVTKALNDIEDFELFMDQIELTVNNFEGDVQTFFEEQILPAMKFELARRKQILEEM